MFQKPKGTVDILPEETVIWHKMEEIIRDCTKNAGFREIRIPTFELSGVYKRGVGQTTDIVQKEMFTLSDRGDNTEMCLRPEGTAGVVRSVIENGLYNEAMPLKLYYIGPFFRYEKPQAGRSREFYQFGVEMFGAESAYADASVIALASKVLHKIGVGTSLHINSIGCPTCRNAYQQKLRAYFEKAGIAAELHRKYPTLLKLPDDLNRAIMQEQLAPHRAPETEWERQMLRTEVKHYIDTSGLAYSYNEFYTQNMPDKVAWKTLQSDLFANLPQIKAERMPQDFSVVLPKLWRKRQAWDAERTKRPPYRGEER